MVQRLKALAWAHGVVKASLGAIFAHSAKLKMLAHTSGFGPLPDGDSDQKPHTLGVITEQAKLSN
jgi:hypothetical protein